ncbi:MAG: hypothetical protein ACFCU3_12530 [Verrucomicrobiales bacterium]
MRPSWGNTLWKSCPTLEPGGESRLVGAVFLSALACFFFAYFHLAAQLVYTTNLDRQKSDQQSNLELAHASDEDWWPQRTNAVANNFWPWLAKKLVDHPNEQEFFLRSKWLNVSLSALFLALGTAVAARYLPWIAVLLLLGLAGLGSLLPRALYFHPEVLFYTGFFACFVLGWKLLLVNSWKLAVLLGIFLAWSHLAKPSIMPLLMVWLGASLWRLTVAWSPLPATRWGGMALWPVRQADSGLWKPGAHLLNMGIVLGVAATLLMPYMMETQKSRGSPLFNIASYWMWHEDYGEESVPFLIEYGHARKIAELPAEEIPSLGNYLKKYGPSHAWGRLTDGVWLKFERFFLPEPNLIEWRPERPWRYLLRYRGLYPVVLGATLLGLLGWLALGYAGGKSRAPANPGGPSTVIFICGTLVGYTLAYGWYEPIGRGDRFMMTLFLPLCFALVWGIEELRKRLNHPLAHVVVSLVYTGLVLRLAWYLVAMLRFPNFETHHPL